MTDRRIVKHRVVDAIFALVVLALATVVGLEASRLPPAPYDAVGPKGVPLLICLVLGALALILLVRAILGLAIGRAQHSLILGLEDEAPTDYRLRPDIAWATFGALLAYVAAMRVIGFRAATILFVAGLGLLYAPRTRRHAVATIAVAIIGGLAVDFLFRKIFFLDLP
jgi:hypothetical protein